MVKKSGVGGTGMSGLYNPGLQFSVGGFSQPQPSLFTPMPASQAKPKDTTPKPNMSTNKGPATGVISGGASVDNSNMSTEAGPAVGTISGGQSTGTQTQTQTPAPVTTTQPAPVIKPQQTQVQPQATQQQIAPVANQVSQTGGEKEFGGEAPQQNIRDLMTDTAKNLKDRLMQVVEQGGTIDNAVRDDMFNQVMAGLGAQYDPSSAQYQQIKNEIYTQALGAMGTGTWEDFYGLADVRVNVARALLDLPSDQIATALVNKSLPLQTITSLRNSNPEKRKEVVKLRNDMLAMNRANQAVSGNQNNDSGVPTAPLSFNEYMNNSVGQFDILSQSSGDVQMYDSLMNSPDLVTKRTELDSVSSEVAQLQLKKQNLKKTLESKITDAAILEAVYLDQVEGINLELQSKQLEQGILEQSLASQQAMQEKRFALFMNERQRVEDRQIQMMGMQREFFKEQISILGSNMNPEYKEYLLGQNIYTQSQMFGLTPQQAEGMLALQNGLNMEKESRGAKDTKYSMTYDKDNNRMMFFDPSDPFNTLQIVDAATGLPVGQKQNSSFWNNSTLTKFGAKDGDWGIDFAAPVGTGIDSPFDGTIKDVRYSAKAGWQVDFMTDDGYLIQINHNDASVAQNLQKGQYIRAGDMIGIVGNTGNVATGEHGYLRKDGQLQFEGAQELLNAGKGAHADVWIKTPSGQYISGQKGVDFLRGGFYKDVAKDYEKAIKSAVSSTSLSNQSKSDIINNVTSAVLEGNTQIAKNNILSVIGDTQTGRTKETYAYMTQAAPMLQELYNQLADYEAKGYDMSLVSGKFENLRARVGKMPVEGEQGQLLLNILNKSNTLMDIFRRAQTGAAINQFEENFYQAFFVNNTDTIEFNKAKLGAFMNTVNSYVTNFVKPKVGGEQVFNRIFGNSVYKFNTQGMGQPISNSPNTRALQRAPTGFIY